MNKREKYDWSAKRIRAQVLRHVDTVATLANAAAILKEYFDFFWIGFYFNKPDHLLLGPFQGPPACVTLEKSHGACAECVETREPVLIPDVEKFPGHVACDERSKSEIVVPLFDANKKIRAVLDIDSDRTDHFDGTDREGLKVIAGLLAPIFNTKPNQESMNEI